MSFSRKSTALVLTTTETEHCIHQKLTKETEKPALADETNYTLVWYAFYDLRSGNGADRH